MRKLIFTTTFLFAALFAVAQQGSNDFTTAKPKHYVNSTEITSGKINPNILRDGDVEAFAWGIYVGYSHPDGVEGEGPMSITLPGASFTQIALNNEDKLYAADYVGDVLYGLHDFYDEISPLLLVDAETGTFDVIGGGILNGRGLAYDVTTQTMYGIDSGGQLFIVDLATGESTLIGGELDGTVSLACSDNGVLYAISTSTDNLHIIDKETGDNQEVGPLGINISYKQEIAFDRDNQVLYGGLSLSGSDGLYTIDVTTGEATLLATTNVELGALAIPYTPISIPMYTVTYSVVGNNGTLAAADADGNPVNSGDEVEEGEVITFTATPEEGYTVKEWTLNGTPVDNLYDSEYTLTITEDVAVTVEFEIINSVDPLDANLISIYPNPSTDGIINVVVDGVAEVHVIDIAGRLVLNQMVNSNGVIDLSAQAEGLYIFTISTPNGRVTKKIIKE